MADISKIKALNGTTYDIKDATARQNVSGKADKVTTATNGNFAALDANGNLKDSGHKHSDYLTSHQDISNKADKVHGAGINGNFAALDSNGNLTDSGHKHSDYLTSADVSGKADKVTGATNGNFASLDANGNLTDSGHKHEDYLTAHRDILFNSTSIGDYNLAFKAGKYTTIDMSTSATTKTITYNLNTGGLYGFGSYSSTKQYNIGDVCTRDGTIYRCKTATPSGGESWNSAHWTQFYLKEDHEAIADLMEDIAIVETSSTALHDISVGKYVVYLGQLYKATANIATGDTLAIGTNLTAVTNGGLNDLNSKVEKKTLLWFTVFGSLAGQTLNINTNGYDGIEVYADNGGYGRLLFTTNGSNYAEVDTIQGVGTNSFYVCSRYFFVEDSNTKIRFTDAKYTYRDGGAGTNNSLLSPRAIYGFKLG